MSRFQDFRLKFSNALCLSRWETVQVVSRGELALWLCWTHTRSTLSNSENQSCAHVFPPNVPLESRFLRSLVSGLCDDVWSIRLWSYHTLGPLGPPEWRFTTAHNHHASEWYHQIPYKYPSSVSDRKTKRYEILKTCWKVFLHFWGVSGTRIKAYFAIWK